MPQGQNQKYRRAKNDIEDRESRWRFTAIPPLLVVMTTVISVEAGGAASSS